MKKVIVFSCILFAFMFSACKKDSAQSDNGAGTSENAAQSTIKTRTCSAKGNYNGMNVQSGTVEVPFETSDEVAVQTDMCNILKMSLNKFDDESFFSDCKSNIKVESLECSEKEEQIKNCQVVGEIEDKALQINVTMPNQANKDEILKSAVCNDFCTFFKQDTPKDKCMPECQKNAKIDSFTCNPVCRAIVSKKDTTLEIKIPVEKGQDSNNLVKSTFCKKYCNTYNRAIGNGRLMPQNECQTGCEADAEIHSIECTK